MPFRERPYSAFNFLVNFGPDKQDPKAGFQEVTGLGGEVVVQEYRAGNKKGNAPDKITGTYKVPDVTLKRGVMGDDALYSWFDEVRKGKQLEALRTVTIELLSEDGETVQLWNLKGARPIKYTGPALSGKATDVAIAELVLACEDIVEETT
ncbi:phage tail-like protein [Humibacillus xanthopallidus]|uniref:Phage tail-like protein n=1 Tax=Humibacillus xanthopallidus TaxID=412689 RepID=A0A543PWX2_9MICO|nr:phage tail protein [Humibacillus xanthopallidus]TQN48556.1 phage tail-like protein [Humibacillus xanthopallidus]